MAYYPSQDIPLKDRGLNWVKLHLDYADSILNRRNNIYGIMERLYNSYNGVKNNDALRFIEKTYGRANKAKFISYRLGRNKLMLLQGEWLNQPLRPTVTTINVDAKVKKLDEADMVKGALLAREELAALKEQGVDVMEGMELPQGDPEEVWNSMSFKDRNEHVMQLILDNAVIELDMKHKLAKNLLDLEITSMCYGKVEMDEQGNVNYIKIDPRDAVYDEIEGDDFIERSPIKGARYRMTLSEVNRRYKLDAKQKQTLKEMESTYTGNSSNGVRNRIYQINGDLCVDVVHIEWISALPTYYKLSPKTKAQLEIDDSTPHYRIQMSAKEYEENKEAYDKMVEKGKLLGIETEWAEDIREAVRIAGVIDLDLDRKKFQARRVDTPNKVIDMSYMGYLYNTVDGMRISLQQIVENFDAAFDVVMYQILKELNTAKGKVLGLNRAGLPQGRTTKEIMYDVLNDGFIDFDSSADGNESGRDMRLEDLINVYDLGVSSSFQQLIMLKNDIRQTLDLITGINDNRQGDIAASSTAANAQMAITASKNMTTPLFYGMTKYTERVFMKICEYSKLSYAFYKVDKGRQILGDSQQKFLEVEKEIGYQDYGVSIQDGGRFMEAKARLMQFAEASLNAKEIRMEDMLAIDAAESFAQANATLKNARKQIQQVAVDQQERELQAQQQMQQQQLEVQMQIAREDREDRQQNEKDNIILQGKVDLELQRNGAMDKLTVDTNNIQQKGMMDGTMNNMSSPPM